MKKRQLAIAVVFGMCILSGCSNYAKTYNENTLVIQKNNTVIEVAVENFKELSLDKSDISSYVEEQINEFNETNGKNKVKKKSLHMEDDGTAKLTLQYQDIDSFNQFNLLQYRLENFSDIEEKTLKGTYTSSDGEKTKYADLQSVENAQVLILSEKQNVVVEGELLYYNEEVTMKDEILATTGENQAVIIFK